LEAAVPQKTSSTKDFIPQSAALEHVGAYERAPKLALTRALAGKVRSRGFIRYHWPPFHEAVELLSPELFTDYPEYSQGPAQIDWAEGTALMPDNGHVHPPCAVYGLEVHRADLLKLWPVKTGAKPRRLSKRLVQQVERASGRPVTSITRDGVTFNFAQPEPGRSEQSVWLDDLKVAKQ
jgi:hypothetical protein